MGACRRRGNVPSDASEEQTLQWDLPAIGTKVVKHNTHSAPATGDVVPRDSWELATDFTPDEFVVDFSDGERDVMARFRVCEATTTGEVVHIDP